MPDLLLELSEKPWFRQTVKSLGLPLPTPQRLRRAQTPMDERPLQDQTVVVVPAELDRVLASALTRAGANPHLVGEPAVLTAAWTDAGEAYGRPAALHALDTPMDLRAHALVFDGTGLSNAADLRRLYTVFHTWLPTLRNNGRVLILGRPPEALKDPEAAAAAAALDGFTRSLAKELGRKGSTANVVYVGRGAEARLEPLLRFLLSTRAAFLTGQPWRLDKRVKQTGEVLRHRVLEGKTALVTGAARGIGAATARLLAAEGAHVICLDRPGDEALCSAVADAIGGTPLLVDITAEDAPARLIEALPNGLDVLIHNAGITRDKTLARMKSEWWDQAVDVNLGAVTRITSALLEADVITKEARIVCLSSVAGLAGNVGQTNYAASKAGLVGYVRALAPILAKRGIAVNAVAPGFIETRLTAAMPVMPREVGRRLSALGQGGLPEDVGQLVLFLSTPGAAGMTGQVARVCGGLFIGA